MRYSVSPSEHYVIDGPRLSALLFKGSAVYCDSGECGESSFSAVHTNVSHLVRGRGADDVTTWFDRIDSASLFGGSSVFTQTASDYVLCD